MESNFIENCGIQIIYVMQCKKNCRQFYLLQSQALPELFQSGRFTGLSSFLAMIHEPSRNDYLQHWRWNCVRRSHRRVSLLPKKRDESLKKIKIKFIIHKAFCHYMPHRKIKKEKLIDQLNIWRIYRIWMCAFSHRERTASGGWGWPKRDNTHITVAWQTMQQPTTAGTSY